MTNRLREVFYILNAFFDIKFSCGGLERPLRYSRVIIMSSSLVNYSSSSSDEAVETSRVATKAKRKVSIESEESLRSKQPNMDSKEEFHIEAEQQDTPLARDNSDITFTIEPSLLTEPQGACDPGLEVCFV